MTIKHKDFAFKLKSVEKTGRITGYASVFNNRDSYNEVVMPGAFADSLAKFKNSGTKPLMLWQHNPDWPIGAWDEFNEDGTGLYVGGNVIKGVKQADEALLLMEADVITGLSIGYREVDVVPADKGDPRKLVKLDLYEASPVSFPANTMARIDAVKAAILGGRLPTLPEFEKWLREAAGFSKSQAAAVASGGLTKLLRSESGGEKADQEVAEFLKAWRG